jgi:hypothetical protein
MPGAGQQRGFMAGFVNIIADMQAPGMTAMAERRGQPLPGSDAAIVSGSAWTQPTTSGAAAVRARDAAFDPMLLEQFAGQVFAAVVTVWAGADAGSVRPVLSDALWEPLAATTGLRKGQINQVAAMQRASAGLTGLHAGAWYDSAMVTMHAHLDVGGEVPPDMPAEMTQWNEDWLFQRSVRPGGDPMIRPEACPGCGAPTQVDGADLCVHCRAPVPFLTTGWLATQIVSHHPIYAMGRQQLAGEMLADPERFQNMPPAMRRLLPPGLLDDPPAGSPPGALP